MIVYVLCEVITAGRADAHPEMQAILASLEVAKTYADRRQTRVVRFDQPWVEVEEDIWTRKSIPTRAGVVHEQTIEAWIVIA